MEITLCLPWMEMGTCELRPLSILKLTHQVIRSECRQETDPMPSTSLSFSLELIDLFEDADGDGFEDHIESSAGSNVNDASSTPFNHGLVAWYPFDGNASDMSGNGNHGTVNGATQPSPWNIGRYSDLMGWMIMQLGLMILLSNTDNFFMEFLDSRKSSNQV